MERYNPELFRTFLCGLGHLGIRLVVRYIKNPPNSGALIHVVGGNFDSEGGPLSQSRLALKVELRGCQL